MKSRHWKILLTKLNINIAQNEVTFGTLWKADLNRNEPIFNEIMSIAMGDKILEIMIAKVKEAWISRDF
jgi:hypothetical protein